MSEEMAVGDNATGEEAKVNGDDAAASAVEVERTSSEQPSEPAVQETQETSAPAEEAPAEEIEEEKPISEELEDPIQQRGIKRRASLAFSENDEEFRGFADGSVDDGSVGTDGDFKGFNQDEQKNLSMEYSRVLERLEAEVSVAAASFTPVRSVMATPPAPPRAVKRPRQDTDGSRPSSALSSRSDGDGISAEGASAASSPANRGRRLGSEMNSPMLRVPMERGWKRELVYRAALDAHSRRAADIYYYTPQGKKLRSTREISEHLTGTGLTLEHFSFFKEPLGFDDPEKEIIRDAKQTRKIDSPVSSPAPITLEGKRMPKPKAPKGASPEPGTPKSPPAKIRVKSVGSRLSNSGAPPAGGRQQKKQPPGTADNNNTAAWKKPRQPPAPAAPAAPAPPPAPAAAPLPTQPPPPLQSRPYHQTAADIKSPRQVVQPCSMTCGRGVPTLACAACLCLYHPACAGHAHAPPPDNFFCKNCRKSTSPPLEPPPLIHKSGVPVTTAPAPATTPAPRRIPVPVPVAVPARSDKRVLLRMKVAGGGPDGERLWAVAKPQPSLPIPKAQPVSTPKPVASIPKPVTLVPKPAPVAVPRPAASPRAGIPRLTVPQSLAVLNGRRFIVVPRCMVHPSAQQ